MSNPNIVTFANGGVSRALTLELMREMRTWIYRGFHEQPDQIRCCSVQRQTYANLIGNPEVIGWDAIPVIADESIPVEQIHWFKNGALVGLMKDLFVPEIKAPTPPSEPAPADPKPKPTAKIKASGGGSGGGSTGARGGGGARG